eukprot:jgi/Botrbrau1/9432/Bobra.0252s0056.1
MSRVSQGLLMCVFMSAAWSVMATFDVDLDNLEGAGTILRALQSGKTCSQSFDKCPNTFSVVPDSVDPSCFYICSWKGIDCRVCCNEGEVYVPGALLGSCTPSTALRPAPPVELKSPPPPRTILPPSPPPSTFPPPSPPLLLSPPPAPPAPAVCPKTFTASPACGFSAQTITIQDLGNKRCAVRFWNGTRYVDGNCTEPFALYPQACGLLNAALTLQFTNVQNLSAGVYEANMDTWLQNLGLASLEILNNSLRVWVYHHLNNVAYPIPTPIAPVFLTSLVQASSVRITEDSGVHETNQMLTALPGLRNLYQLFAGSLGTTITVINTAFTNMTSFSGLTCPPAAIFLIDNPRLATFAGLEAVSAPSRQRSQPYSGLYEAPAQETDIPSPLAINSQTDALLRPSIAAAISHLMNASANFADVGVVLLAPYSGPFLTTASLDPIKVMMGCSNNVTSIVDIPVACGISLTDSSQICTYVPPSQCRCT